MGDHEFLFKDINKTIEYARKINNENLVLKARIKKSEKVLGYSLINILSAVKSGNMKVFKCSNCTAKYHVLGEKIPQKVFKIFCSNCQTLHLYNKKSIMIIRIKEEGE